MIEEKTLQDLFEELKDILLYNPELKKYKILEFKTNQKGDLIIETNLHTKNENNYNTIIIHRAEEY